jgi:hypothetical protein
VNDDFRRRPADGMGVRVSVLENELRSMGKRLEAHMASTNQLISRLDERADKHDVMFARLIGALIVVQALVILFAPTIRAVLGVATQ